MKKKIAAIVIFIFVLVFPMVSWPILFPLDNTELNENRKLAEFPQFNNEFFINFDKYFTDHVPFRNDYIRFYSKFDNWFNKVYSKLLNSMGYYHFVSKWNVLFGKEDWLFYLGDDSLKYYVGSNLPTKEELDTMIEKLEKVDRYFKSLGKEFAVFIAPNKEQIFFEFMPDGIRVVNQKKRMDMILEYLQENSDVKFIYPKEEILEAKKDRQVYYKYDTHWNLAGSYAGVLPLLEALGISAGEGILTEVVATNGDLTDMIGEERKKSIGYDLIYRPEYSYNIVNNNDNFTCSSTNPNGKNLLLLGDSFRIDMIPILAKEYQTSNFYPSTYFSNKTPCEAEFAAADTIIFESVERYEKSRFLGLVDKFIEMYNL